MLMHQHEWKIPPLADRAAMVKAARDAAMHDVQHWHVAEQKKWASARQFDPAAGGQLDILEYGPTELNDGKFPYSIRKNHMKETRSEEHTSELQSLMRTSYAVFCLKTKK